jgi:hypothetical protein
MAFCDSEARRGQRRKAVAVLLRGAPAVKWYKQIPLEVCYALEELLDPRSPCNPFARPKLPPPNMIQEVDGKPRFKAAIEVESAAESAAIERRRLLEVAKRSGDKLGEDAAALLAFARDKGDKTALAAFARERRAWAKWSEVLALTYNAVRVTIKPLTQRQCHRILRANQIFGEMLAAIQGGASVSEAAEIVGEKLMLSGRRVLANWKETLDATPAFPDSEKGKRRR